MSPVATEEVAVEASAHACMSARSTGQEKSSQARDIFGESCVARNALKSSRSSTIRGVLVWSQRLADWEGSIAWVGEGVRM